MKLITPPLVVNDDDSFENDLFGRRESGESLLNIVTNCEDALVVSVNAGWGEGKSTFIQMWKGLLQKNGIPNIYIDACSCDYIDDPFISVVSAITAYTEERTAPEHQKILAGLKEQFVKVGKKLLPMALKISTRAAMSGVVQEGVLNHRTEIEADSTAGLSGVISSVITERIENHTNDIKMVAAFRLTLSKLPSILSKDRDKPLVIIVDGLDRCKPTYAVEMIEKIKHLFSVKNIIFVLAMNQEQIERSIRSIYGYDIDAGTYLQKFINLEMPLPKRTAESHQNDLKIYSEQLIRLHEIETWGDSVKIVDCADSLANHFNLSLRQLENVFTYITLFDGASTEKQFRLVPIVVMMSTLRVVDYSLFTSLLKGRSSLDEVTKELNLDNINLDNKRIFATEWILDLIRYSLMSDDEYAALPEDDEIRVQSQSLSHYHLKRSEIIPYHAKMIHTFSI